MGYPQGSGGMTVRRKWAAALALALAAAAWGGPARAGCGGPAVDVVLVLDDSGSMAAGEGAAPPADPQGIRGTAAHLLLDLLAPGDRPGVVVFASAVRATPVMHLGAGAAQLHGAVALRGAGATDLAGALEVALAALAAVREPGRPQAVVVITDGRPEGPGGPADQERRLLAAARGAASAGVRVYAVGLGPGAALDLLRRLAQEARSPLPRRVEGAADLPAAFVDLLLDLKGAAAWRLQPGAPAALPPLARSLAMVALRPAGARGLEAPSLAGAPVVRREWPGLTVGYDLVRLEPAPAGPLPVPAAAGSALWAVADPAAALAVRAPAPRAQVEAGQPVRVEADLAACGGSPPPPDRLAVRAELVGEDRRQVAAVAGLRPVGGGRYAGELVVPAAGEWALRVQAALDGRPLAVQEVPVTATAAGGWRLVVPDQAWTLAPVPVAVVYQEGARQAPGDRPPRLVARHGACPPQAVALQPEGVGRWVGRATPCAEPGTLTVADPEAGLAVAVPVLATPFVPQAPERAPEWTWWEALLGRPQAVALRVHVPTPVPEDLLPRPRLSGAPVRVAGHRWSPWPGGGYTLTLTLVPLPRLALAGGRHQAQLELLPAGPQAIAAPPVAVPVAAASPLPPLAAAAAAGAAALAWRRLRAGRAR